MRGRSWEVGSRGGNIAFRVWHAAVGLIHELFNKTRLSHPSSPYFLFFVNRPATSYQPVATGQGVEQQEGVRVTDLMGVHAGANSISGDFSLQAPGLKIEGGEAAYPVENFTISGNLFELLERVVAVGSELEWSVIFLVAGSPSVEVANVAFAGA